MCRLWLRSCAPTRDDTPPPHPIRSTCAPRGTASRYRCSSLATAQVHSVSEEISIRDAFRVVVGVRGQLEREDVEPHLDVNRRRAERELRASEIRTSVWSSLECLPGVSPVLFYHQGPSRGHQRQSRGHQGPSRSHQGRSLISRPPRKRSPASTRFL